MRFGTESQDSPRESYDDASEDFNFVGRFNHDRPTPTVNDTVGGTTAGQIYGNPEIFYQIIHTHASLVGDGGVTASQIDSGSATADQPLLADGSGGTGFRDPVIHGGNLIDNTIPTAKYGNDSVTKSKLGANAKITANPSGTDGDNLTRLAVGESNYKIPGHDGAVTHIESGATYNNNVITVSTPGTVRGGDGILFAVPTPFGTSSTQAVSLAIDGQANSEHPLRDRNGDALHEDDLTAGSVYVAISDADSWDVLVLPVGSGGGTVHTAGTAFPANPVTGQLFTFTASASSISAKLPDETTDLTFANGGDLFRFNGTDWCGRSLVERFIPQGRPFRSILLRWVGICSPSDKMLPAFPRGTVIWRRSPRPARVTCSSMTPANGSARLVTGCWLRVGSDSSIAGVVNSWVLTDVDQPDSSKTWGFVNFGFESEYRRFKMSDFRALSNVAANNAASTANSVSFVVLDHQRVFIAPAAGNKVALAWGDSSATPTSFSMEAE